MTSPIEPINTMEKLEKLSPIILEEENKRIEKIRVECLESDIRRLNVIISKNTIEDLKKGLNCGVNFASSEKDLNKTFEPLFSLRVGPIMGVNHVIIKMN